MKKKNKEAKLIISFGNFFKIENINPNYYSIILVIIILGFVILFVKLD